MTQSLENLSKSKKFQKYNIVFFSKIGQHIYHKKYNQNDQRTC